MNGDRQTDLFIFVCLVAAIARRRSEIEKKSIECEQGDERLVVLKDWEQLRECERVRLVY